MLPKYLELRTLIHVSTSQISLYWGSLRLQLHVSREPLQLQKGQSLQSGLTEPWKQRSVNIKYMETGGIKFAPQGKGILDSIQLGEFPLCGGGF